MIGALRSRDFRLTLVYIPLLVYINETTVLRYILLKVQEMPAAMVGLAGLVVWDTTRRLTL